MAVPSSAGLVQGVEMCLKAAGERPLANTWHRDGLPAVGSPAPTEAPARAVGHLVEREGLSVISDIDDTVKAAGCDRSEERRR